MPKGLQVVGDNEVRPTQPTTHHLTNRWSVPDLALAAMELPPLTVGVVYRKEGSSVRDYEARNPWLGGSCIFKI